MENNKLIKSEGLLFKLKRFFSNIFIKKEKIEVQKEKIEVQKDNVSKKELFYKEKLAKKLFVGEIDVNDLTNEEVDEMITYFEKDIELKDREIERIKKHIISMQNKLKKTV